MSKKITTTRFASPPLLSWDIFMNGYRKRLALADDFNRLNKLALSNKWITEWDLESKLFQQGKVIVVTDPLLRIVYASCNVYEMNGYTEDEMKGKTPKMFQGPETSPEAIAKVRDAINNVRPVEVTLLNYRKNRETYYCHIEEFPVFNKNRELSNFIAFEDIPTVSVPSL